MSPSRTSASTRPGTPFVAASPMLLPEVRGSSRMMFVLRPYNIAYRFRRNLPRFSSTTAIPQSCEVRRGVPGGFASREKGSYQVTDQQRHREHKRKNWVVRGRERPARSGLPRRLTPRSSLPPTYYQKPEPEPKQDRHEYPILSGVST